MAGHLPQEQIAAMEEAFAFFDKNGDGLITIEELRVVLESLGQNNTTLELQWMIAEVDADGDGAINFSEFLKLMELKPNDTDSEEELTGAFRMFDIDEDGFISEAELFLIMYNRGCNLNGAEVREMMQEADTDGDGRVSYEEFKQIMNRI
ncbi:unnamed protein product [Urochloa decumbens]|uniref:EF-hand domain-containing protein n=1 Tax=Urochloa decumbens TaxID=240449 RepID=A0ABC8YJY2_9POAL